MKNELQQVILNKLSNLLIIENFALSWSNYDVKILNFFIEKDVLTTEDIKRALHKVLLQAGRKSFVQHVINGKYPDHTHAPEALAYALANNEFTLEEEKQIHFDHGETKGEFIQLYKKDVLEKLTQSVLTEQKPYKKFGAPESDCCECFESH